ncbi:hypothetical protein MTR_6g464600 [Medicago truncatula]|uniref:Uncharacterized protein n=1 Tax=Medicago truncatula TaxID=3880 RepID=A0A072UA90_MEDTR|nr:hypothetical protein MTR_6g464600 [Medicago truncatula]
MDPQIGRLQQLSFMRDKFNTIRRTNLKNMAIEPRKCRPNNRMNIHVRLMPDKLHLKVEKLC